MEQELYMCALLVRYDDKGARQSVMGGVFMNETYRRASGAGKLNTLPSGSKELLLIVPQSTFLSTGKVDGVSYKVKNVTCNVNADGTMNFYLRQTKEGIAKGIAKVSCEGRFPEVDAGKIFAVGFSRTTLANSLRANNEHLTVMFRRDTGTSEQLLVLTSQGAVMTLTKSELMTKRGNKLKFTNMTLSKTGVLSNVKGCQVVEITANNTMINEDGEESQAKEDNEVVQVIENRKRTSDRVLNSNPDMQGAKTGMSSDGTPLIRYYDSTGVSENDYNTALGRIAIVKSKMMEIDPYIYSLLARIPTNPTDRVETIGVTTTSMMFNPEFIMGLEFAELSFILIHEAMHIALGHVIQGMGKQHRMHNVATDIYINEYIKELFHLKQYGVTYSVRCVGGEIVTVEGKQERQFQIQVPNDGCFSRIITGNETTKIDLQNTMSINIYNKLLRDKAQILENLQNQQNQQGGGQQGQQGNGQQGNGQQGGGQQGQQGNGQQGNGQQGNGQQGNGQQGNGQQGNGQQGNGQQGNGQQGNGQQGNGQQGNGQDGNGQGQNGNGQGQDGNGQGQNGNGQGQDGNGQGQDGNGQNGNGQNGSIADDLNQMGNQQVSNQGSNNANGSQNGNNKIGGYKEIKVTVNGQTHEVKVMDDIFRENDKLDKRVVQDAQKRLIKGVNKAVSRMSGAKDRGSGLSRALFGMLENKLEEDNSISWRAKLKSMLQYSPEGRYNMAIYNKKALSYGVYRGTKTNVNQKNVLKNLYICFDTSGSMSPEEIQTAINQAYHLVKTSKIPPKNLYVYVMFWDTGIQSIYEIRHSKEMGKIVIPQGGGTDPTCIFDYIAGRISVKNPVDDKIYKVSHKVQETSGIIIFTDGYIGRDYAKPEYQQAFGKKTYWVIDGGKEGYTEDLVFGTVVTRDDEKE